MSKHVMTVMLHTEKYSVKNHRVARNFGIKMEKWNDAKDTNNTMTQCLRPHTVNFYDKYDRNSSTMPF